MERKHAEELASALNDARNELRELSAQLAAVTAREEQAQVQLAGCGAAAIGATDPSQTAKPGDYGWSASYGDVLALRLRSDALRARLAAVTKERDEARSEDRDVVYRRLLRERDALKARVAALEKLAKDVCTDFGCVDEDAADEDGHVDDCWFCYAMRVLGLDAKEGG